MWRQPAAMREAQDQQESRLAEDRRQRQKLWEGAPDTYSPLQQHRQAMQEDPARPQLPALVKLLLPDVVAWDGSLSALFSGERDLSSQGR